MKRLTFLFFILIICSCSNEESKRWMVIDLEILKIENDISTEAILFIGYEYQVPNRTQAPITEIYKVKIGETKNGLYFNKLKLKDLSENFDKKKILNLYVEYTKETPWVEIPYYIPEVIRLNRQNTNSIRFSMRQFAFDYKVKLININCFDANDTLWIEENKSGQFNGEYVYSFTGCYNDYMLDYTTPSYHEDLFYQIKSKKNNIIDSSVLHFSLQKGMLNELEIKY